MNRNIITPNEAAGMTKYGVDVEEAEPAAILVGMHKRVVGTERKITQLAELLSSFKIEFEMLAEEVKVLQQSIVSTCECKKRSEKYTL